MDENQEEILDRQEATEIHRANIQARGPSHGDRARMLQTVLESELETEDGGLSNLSAQDFALANYDERIGPTEFKWMQEIVNVFSKACYPHPESGLTGLSRAWATGDPTNRREPLPLDDVARDETYLLGTYSRAKRGEGMAQQETASKTVRESLALSDESSGGGLISRAKSKLGR